MTITTKGAPQYLQAMERLEWNMYCAARFIGGSQAEVTAGQRFHKRVLAAWHCMYDAARRRGVALDFTALGLSILSLRALDRSCVYCSQPLSLDAVGYSWAVPAERAPASCWRQANLVICCAECAQGKGSLSHDEWLDVMAALRAADPVAGRSARQALALGRSVMARPRQGKRYFPPPPARE